MIVNNRTAFVVYATPGSDTGEVAVLGKGSADVWGLASANNA